MASPRTVRLRLRFADPTRSEWCGGCGRRRMADGRCPRCDAWWASPLISVGVPLIFATVVLLAIGVRVLRDSERAAAPSRSEMRAASLAALPPAMAFPRSDSGAVAGLPPVVFAEEPQFEQAGPRPRTRPRPISMAEQVRLRQLSDHAHTVVALDDAARDRAREDARRGSSSVEVHDAPFTPPASTRNGVARNGVARGGGASGGSLPLPGQTRAPGANPSAAASSFFEMFAPASATRPSSLPQGNYAPGASVPTNSEVR